MEKCDREEEEIVFHLLVRCQNGHGAQGWVRPKLGAWNSNQVFHMNGRAQGLGHPRLSKVH